MYGWLGIAIGVGGILILIVSLLVGIGPAVPLPICDRYFGGRYPGPLTDSGDTLPKRRLIPSLTRGPS